MENAQVPLNPVTAMTLWEAALNNTEYDWTDRLDKVGYAQARNDVASLLPSLVDAEKLIEKILGDDAWPIPYDWEFVPMWFSLVRWDENGSLVPSPDAALAAWKSHCRIFNKPPSKQPTPIVVKIVPAHRYEIRTHTIYDGWINVWSHDGKPAHFGTYAEALAEIDRYIKNVRKRYDPAQNNGDPFNEKNEREGLTIYLNGEPASQ